MTESLPSALAIRELPAPKYYEVVYARRYRHEEGVRGWSERALIAIDETKGHLSIESGYGKFSFIWTAEGRGGESLHGFLYDLDFDYFMKKASTKPHRIPDHERTVRELRADLLRRRREAGGWPRDWMTKERAREMWDEIDYWESDYQGADFVRKLFEDSNWAQFLDYSDPTCTMEDPGLRRFWEELWRPFAENVLRHWWLINRQQRPARHLARLQKEKRWPIHRRRALCVVEAA
jgi:hypothetical protein